MDYDSENVVMDKDPLDDVVSAYIRGMESLRHHDREAYVNVVAYAAMLEKLVGLDPAPTARYLSDG